MGLENRLKYSEKDLEMTQNKLNTEEKQMAAIDRELSKKKPEMKL